MIFLGSCFSEHILKKLSQNGFKCFDSPNGICFNPISILNPFEKIIKNEFYQMNDLIEKNGIYFSKFHHGKFQNQNPNDLLVEINNELLNFKNQLKKTQYIFISLGSAFVYTLSSTKEIVANCHKLEASNFKKELLSVNAIVESFEKTFSFLTENHPNINIVLTVSPVKHLRDGVIENVKSKSTLILSINELIKKHPKINYFPSFELLNEDLRDYRFYENDGAHPNQLAIDYIFEQFKNTYLSETSLSLLEQHSKLNQLKSHKSINNNGIEYQKWQNHIQEETLKLEQMMSDDTTNK